MKARFQWWVPAISLAVLAGMYSWQSSVPDRSVGKPYRDKIAQRFSNYPKMVGNGSMDGVWEGVDKEELPPQAVALLHPNFYLNRRYVNRVRNWTVDLLLIEAEESRDMMGHYPPNCYPGNGWQLIKTAPASNKVDSKPEWLVDGLRIKGREYEFVRNSEQDRLWVRDFFILPNGTFYADISTFGRAAADFAIRPYGATQVQVIYPLYYSPEEREKIFQSLMLAHMDLLQAMSSKD